MEMSISNQLDARSQDTNTPITNTRETPTIVEVPLNLKSEVETLRQSLVELQGDLSSNDMQERIRQTLMANPAWAEWILENRSDVKSRPILVRAGLGIERDDEGARRMLMGLALCMEPKSEVPPYSMGNLAVTEVIASPSASRESHSENDLPAPPHTAGFFEDVPPHTCYFACIRPHPGGGGETTVVNINAILTKAPQALIDEWSNNPYILRTSRRLGEQLRPFQLLRWVNGAPFLRYRKEYTPGFESDLSLRLLEELITDPANHFVVRLEAGETLIHWNGAPHSRFPQDGPTPDLVDQRRKLIRCRTRPREGWREQFHASAPQFSTH